MCQKIPYETKADAVAHARSMALQNRYFSKSARGIRKSGRKLRPYDCLFCGFWHLTTRKK